MKIKKGLQDLSLIYDDKHFPEIFQYFGGYLAE